MNEERTDLENVDWGAVRNRQIDWRKSENSEDLYTNSVQIRISVFDIALHLGLIEEATTERFVAKEVVRVIMSPQHAKALSDVLVEKLAEYERVFGKIPQSPVGQG